MGAFCGFAFDGGESLAALLRRAAAWQPPCALAVGHGGWMTARQWRGVPPQPATWPQPPRYGQCWQEADDLGAAATSGGRSGA